MSADRHPHRACRCCGKVGRIIGYGWRASCYRRWQAAGEPPTGPPPPRTDRGHRPGHDVAAAVEDFEFLRTVRKLSPARAAAALGVSVRTAQRYEARLKAASR